MATATRIMPGAGTTLAADGVVPEAPRPAAADVWRGRRNLYFIQEAQNVSRWVMLLGALVHAGLIAILVTANYPLWRILSIAGLFTVFGGTQRLFIHKGRTQERCVE